MCPAPPARPWGQGLCLAARVLGETQSAPESQNRLEQGGPAGLRLCSGTPEDKPTGLSYPARPASLAAQPRLSAQFPEQQ